MKVTPMIHREMFTPRKLPKAMESVIDACTGIAIVSDHRLTSPVNAVSDAKVTRRNESPRRPMRTPLTPPPSSAPAAIVMGRARPPETPALRSIPNMMARNAMIAPTDRSTAPAIMTNVIPIATTHSCALLVSNS